jgi:tetratricopeptide (TPR) repeat protein
LEKIRLSEIITVKKLIIEVHGDQLLSLSSGEIMDKKSRLLNLLSLAYQEERQFIARLSNHERTETGTMERWSAKDTIAHNAFWKQHRAEQITAPDNEALTSFRDFERLNAHTFEENFLLSWADIQENARIAYEYLSERVEALSDLDLNYPDRYAWLNGRPLWRTVAISGYYHPLSHIAGYLYERGQVQKASEMHDVMAENLQALDDDEEWRGVTLYNLACFYATTSRAPQAIHHLTRALHFNPGLVEWARQDSDLSILHGEPEYEELYEQR